MNKVLHRCLRTVPVPNAANTSPQKTPKQKKQNKTQTPPKKTLKKTKGSQMMFPQTYEINELRITQTTAGKGGSHHCPEDFTS